MPLVLIQTTVPNQSGKPFRITEVLERVATSAEEALGIAASHIGVHTESHEICDEFLTARWNEKGGYWLVSWHPMPEAQYGERVLLM